SFYRWPLLRLPHSFPTRRSSDIRTSTPRNLPIVHALEPNMSSYLLARTLYALAAIPAPLLAHETLERPRLIGGVPVAVVVEVDVHVPWRGPRARPGGDPASGGG